MEGKVVNESGHSHRFGAFVLVGLGTLFLAENILQPLFHIHVLNWNLIWPLIVIGLGIHLLSKRVRA